MMRTNNPGFQKEDRIINAIDGKKFNEIGNNLKFALKRIFFNSINEEMPFFAEKADPRGKPDIILKHNGETHFISIKSGAAKEFHREDVFKFVGFLKECKMDENAINPILYFQFGDGTTDGTGEKRMDYSDTFHEYKDKISESNKILNSDKSFLEKFLERVIFKGNYVDLPAAEFVYFGDENYGTLCSKRQLLTYVKNKYFGWYQNPHIGPILMRPYARYVNGNGMHPEKRSIICFEWVGLEKDMRYISERYDD